MPPSFPKAPSGIDWDSVEPKLTPGELCSIGELSSIYLGSESAELTSDSLLSSLKSLYKLSLSGEGKMKKEHADAVRGMVECGEETTIAKGAQGMPDAPTDHKPHGSEDFAFARQEHRPVSHGRLGHREEPAAAIVPQKQAAKRSVPRPAASPGQHKQRRDAELEGERLKASCKSLQAENSRLKAAVGDMTGSFNGLQVQLAEMQRLLAQSEKRAGEAEAAHSEELLVKEHQIDSLSEQASMLNGQVSALKHELDAARGRQQKLLGDLASVLEGAKAHAGKRGK